MSKLDEILETYVLPKDKAIVRTMLINLLYGLVGDDKELAEKVRQL